MENPSKESNPMAVDFWREEQEMKRLKRNFGIVDDSWDWLVLIMNEKW